MNRKRKERRKKNEMNPFLQTSQSLITWKDYKHYPKKQKRRHKCSLLHPLSSCISPILVFVSYFFPCLFFSFPSAVLIIIFLFFSPIRSVFRALQPLPIRGRKCLICSTKYCASIFHRALPHFSFFSPTLL